MSYKNLLFLNVIKMKSLSRVRLFATPWPVQAPSWNFPGKDTVVGCHFLLQGIFLTQGSTGASCTADSLPSAAAAAKSLQSCPTLCDPIHGSPPGSPVPGILQARTLEWVFTRM